MVVDSGSDGLAGFAEALDDGKAMYGAVQYDLGEGRLKIVYVTWVPDGVPTVIKGAVNTHAETIGKHLKVLYSYLFTYIILVPFSSFCLLQRLVCFFVFVFVFLFTEFPRSNQCQNC
jgi:hypothetical protein